MTELKTDPTQKFQRTVQNTLKQCKNIIDPIKIKQVHQMNPQAPKLKAKIKIHKPEAPIRPVINNTNAPTNKLVWGFVGFITPTTAHSFGNICRP